MLFAQKSFHLPSLSCVLRPSTPWTTQLFRWKIGSKFNKIKYLWKLWVQSGVWRAFGRKARVDVDCCPFFDPPPNPFFPTLAHFLHYLSPRYPFLNLLKISVIHFSIFVIIWNIFALLMLIACVLCAFIFIFNCLFLLCIVIVNPFHSCNCLSEKLPVKTIFSY